MKIILLKFLLFTTLFSSFLAQKNSLHDSKDLASDVSKVSSPPEENDSSRSMDDGNVPVNVGKILEELRAERAKNRDLNQTISDILAEMEDMKKNIIRNEEKITENQSSVVLLSKDVDDLTEEVAGVHDDVVTVAEDVVIVAGDVERNSAHIANVTGDVVSLTEDVTSLTDDFDALADFVGTLTASDQEQEKRIQENIKMLDTLATRGIWSAFHKDSWTASNAIITYDRLIINSNNMNITDTPLDIKTGN